MNQPAVLLSDITLFEKLAKEFNQPWLFIDTHPDEDVLLSVSEGTFTIHFEENPEGARQEKKVFVVTAYESTGYSYHNPPETIDTELARVHSLWDALRFILIAAISQEIDAAAQATGEAELHLHLT